MASNCPIVKYIPTEFMKYTICQMMENNCPLEEMKMPRPGPTVSALPNAVSPGRGKCVTGSGDLISSGLISGIRLMQVSTDAIVFLDW
jgi:hypothetical protein